MIATLVFRDVTMTIPGWLFAGLLVVGLSCSIGAIVLNILAQRRK